MTYTSNLPARRTPLGRAELTDGSRFDLLEIAEDVAFDSGLAQLVMDEMFDLAALTVEEMARFTHACGESSLALAESGFRSQGFREFLDASFQLTGKMALTMLGTAQQGMINRAKRNLR